MHNWHAERKRFARPGHREPDEVAARQSGRPGEHLNRRRPREPALQALDQFRVHVQVREVRDRVNVARHHYRVGLHLVGGHSRTHVLHIVVFDVVVFRDRGEVFLFPVFYKCFYF